MLALFQVCLNALTWQRGSGKIAHVQDNLANKFYASVDAVSILAVEIKRGCGLEFVL